MSKTTLEAFQNSEFNFSDSSNFSLVLQSFAWIPQVDFIAVKYD